MHHVRELIDKKQYVLDSDWGESQPGAEQQNAYLERHGWDDYAALAPRAHRRCRADETKARYAFVCGDFRRVHRSGLIACVYRAVRMAPQGGGAGGPPAPPAPRQGGGLNASVRRDHVQLDAPRAGESQRA